MIREQIWWYFARSAGLLTWATACASIILGLVMSTRKVGRKTNGPWVLDLHRFLSGLTIIFMALHMFALWADSFVTFGWAALLVPGASDWRPLPVAFGVLAFWILIGVEVSSLVKNHIPHQWWKALHLGSYAVAILGTVHGLTAGSDVGNPIVRVLGAVTLLVIVVLTVLRVIEATGPADEVPDRLAAARELQNAADGAQPTPASTAPTATAPPATVPTREPVSEPPPIPIVPTRRPSPTSQGTPGPGSLSERLRQQQADQAAARSR